MTSDIKLKIPTTTIHLGVPLPKLSVRKFSTNAQVLRHLFYLQNKSPRKLLKPLYKDVFDAAKQPYVNNSVKHVHPINGPDIIRKLHNDWIRLRKFKASNRDCVPTNIDTFQQQLHENLDLSPKARGRPIKKPRRGQSQNVSPSSFPTCQPSQSLSGDTAVPSSSKNSQPSLSLSGDTADISSSQTSQSLSDDTADISSSQTSQSLSDDTADLSSSQNTQPSKSSSVYKHSLSEMDSITSDPRDEDGYILLRFSKNFLTDLEIVGALDRTLTSSDKGIHIISSVIKAGGGDINDFSLSRKTLDRARNNGREEAGKHIEDTINLPPFIDLQWDGKMLENSQGKRKEHLAVVGSGGSYREGKILGTHSIKDSTGESQAEECLRVITKWGISENVKACCFDTTYSNTGPHKGAVPRLMKALGKKLLALGCRHHIPELYVKAGYEFLFGYDKSDDLLMLKRFRDTEYDQLDKTSDGCIQLLPNSAISTELEQSWKARTVECLKRVLSTDRHLLVRGDYKVFAELVLVVLGEMPYTGFHKPGAVHKARFLARVKYVLMMFLLRFQLKLDPRSRDSFIRKLERMTKFIVLIYAPYWFTSPNAADAPVNDLQLYHDMVRYKQVDNDVADQVLRKVRLHTEYLAPETTIFALFSGKVDDDQKQEIASAILSHQRPEDIAVKLPEKVDLKETTALPDLITEESYTAFNLLHLDHNWLQDHPAIWELSEDYTILKDFIINLKVTNDTAERAVKMMKDYAAKLTKDDSLHHFMMQMVEAHRNMYPNTKKKTLMQRE